MKNVLLGMILTLSTTVFGAAGGTQSIVLTEANHFAIKGQFNERLLDEFAKKIYTNKEKTLNLYFDSPGGSVVSLARMLGIMKQAQSGGVKFVCVVRFAASAAFLLFQQCDERLLFEDGILMAHDASGSFYGEVSRMEKQLKMINELMKVVSLPAARKMGLTYDAYKALTVNELWLTSMSAFEYNAADNTIIDVTCNADLLARKKEITISFLSLFGAISQKYKVSACPLLNGSEKVNDKDEEENNESNTNARDGLRLRQV